ncbi:PREDICTED: uncharacterized protein LOC100633742 [Amphimedon queenslandica]|uniref:Uncharacterized protein n=1 Tax=Amphimedon queenslandica TaxID=400682 RepID=A0A1X7SUN6_AMPQE|nr:PREDICTED: uncharacterized protein LOC100633742 [Amphimedon queenslandica]XP_019862687.1 PREDICTED: uncharacterized protein LOC100633742 [Amphimedon queenslandica]|eukprot:XP_003391606.1 PREDICTED: uncharacterized protein LOC100633742 [Amphimedon queenslandica]
MARVLVKFFIIFFISYAIGVAVIVITAELCRQKNQALRESGNASATISRSNDEADILYSHTRGRNKDSRYTLPSDSHLHSEGRDISQGIGFYYRHFVFDYKTDSEPIVITLFNYRNHTESPPQQAKD